MFDLLARLVDSANDNTINGGEGDDTLIGSVDKDVVVYSGNQADYEFSLDSSGRIIVHDLNTTDGNEGRDALLDIESVRFADGDIQLSYQDGGEFHVNTQTSGDQSEPKITALTNGGFVVTWASANHYFGPWDIFGQRFDVNGVAQGNEFPISITTAYSPSSHSVVALPNGEFVVIRSSHAQDSSNPEIYGQRYDANGIAQGDEFLISTNTTESSTFSVTKLNDGSFIVVWGSPAQDFNVHNISGQRYDADGVAQGGEFLIGSNATQSGSNSPLITALADDGFLVTWISREQFGADIIYDITGQRYDANGVAQGGEFLINTVVTDAVPYYSIAALVDGGFVASWTFISLERDSLGNVVYENYVRRFDSNGIAQSNKSLFSPTQSARVGLDSITELTDGSFLAIWNASEENDASNIYGQRFDANGVAIDSEFLVNTYTPGIQGGEEITVLANGQFVVTWKSIAQESDDVCNRFLCEGGIYAQRFDIEGNKIGNLALTGDTSSNTLHVADNTKAPISLLGLEGDDWLQGGGGNDILDGGVGADNLAGGLGDDSYIVDNVNDIITEYIDEGIDQIDSSVTFMLPDNVENLNLTGTQAINGIGNDLDNILTGNSSDNALDGGAGNDLLIAGHGRDDLTGGIGDDIFKFFSGADFVIHDFAIASDLLVFDSKTMGFDIYGVTHLLSFVSSVEDTSESVTIHFIDDIASITFVGFSSEDLSASMVGFGFY